MLHARSTRSASDDESGGPADAGLDARVESALRGVQPAVLLAFVAAAVALAWACRFVQDDAFVSFVYARNLVRGEGLTWFGARVEGYTNPLWVMWIAAGLGLGVDPVVWSWSGGLLAFVAALVAVRQLTRRLLGRELPALFAGALFAANYSVLAYATGGLETMAQTALLAWSAVAAERLDRSGAHAAAVAAALSILVAAAALTHPDSVLPGAILSGWAVVGMARRGSPRAAWAALLLPGALIVGSWLAWKLRYYGSVLPNTYYAKSGVTSAMLENGALFVGRFLHWYLLWLPLAAGLLCVAARRQFHRRLVVPLLVVLSWLAYVVSIGGDFMEFRLLVPIAPMLFLLVAYLVCDQIAPSIRIPATVASLVMLAILTLASGYHARTFRGFTPDLTLDSIDALGTFYGVYPDRQWNVLGDALREQLGGADPLLAMHPVGAIPYFGGLRTVDQLGLTDAYVARHGVRADASYRRPGHQRHAPLDYLRSRGVNFVIGHPTLMPLDVFAKNRGDSRLWQWAGGWIESTVEFQPAPVSEATLVLLPVRPGSGLVMWYLTPTAALDATIAAGNWPTMRFTFPPPVDDADHNSRP